MRRFTARRMPGRYGRIGRACHFLPDAVTLRAGAVLGRQIAALLDPETPVPGVTDLRVRPELRGLGELAILRVEARKRPIFNRCSLGLCAGKAAW